MENEVSQPTYEHANLANQILSEFDLCLMLGVSASTLSVLRRDKGFPFIRMNKTNRAYSVDDVLVWLKGRAVNE